MACALIRGSPIIRSNPIMQECDIGSFIPLSGDLERFASSNKENEKQESCDSNDSHNVSSVPYDSMPVLVSSNEEKSDLRIQNQAHVSQFTKPCNSSLNTTLNALYPLHTPLESLPIDLAHPLHRNLPFLDSLPKLGFEKKSVSISLRNTYEKVQLQQFFCSMESCASPSLTTNQKDCCEQSYVFPSSHVELEFEKNNDGVPMSSNESHSNFKTQVRECGGAILDASQNVYALKEPKVATLNDQTVITLTMDKKWPFLLRFPICCFGINLGLGSQTILWKILASQKFIWSMKVPALINLVLWCVAILLLIMGSIVYALKVVFYFEAVRQEFNHPIRVNFFFAPWAAYILLALGAPPSIASYLHLEMWILFIVPIFTLNLKVYGDWLANGERNLCKVANPCTHLSIMGNFMGALLIGTIGYKELALFFWSIGFVHYLVLLVTLYQRLPSATVLPKELHPVLFLFIALPCGASVAWAKIVGKFDMVAKMIYFVAMFLFFSLVVRYKNFYGFRFNISWWAYTFPLTISAIATVHYCFEVNHFLTQTLATCLILASSLVVFSLAITTLLHTFVWKSMFPNDMAIEICRR